MRRMGVGDLVGVGLVEDVLDGLLDCIMVLVLGGMMVVKGEDVPEWMESASLSGISMLNSSSMAMTTSTVSRESRPRSLAK